MGREYTSGVFESIRGPLVLKEAARCVVEAAGLGYSIHISLSTYEDLPRQGEPVSVYLHPVVREDGWRLFGFSRSDEREVFRDLLRVNGVGPLMALSLLSGFRPKELAAAVGQGDVRALTRVKGIGKKTAERILVELKDRWSDVAAAAGVIDGAGAASTAAGDAVQALTSLGLDAAEAHRRVKKVLEKQPELDVSDLVRVALRM